MFYGGGGGLVVKLCITLETQWTEAHQTPPSMEFPRQEQWSGLLFLSPIMLYTQPNNCQPLITWKDNMCICTHH